MTCGLVRLKAHSVHLFFRLLTLRERVEKFEKVEQSLDFASNLVRPSLDLIAFSLELRGQVVFTSFPFFSYFIKYISLSLLNKLV